MIKHEIDIGVDTIIATPHHIYHRYEKTVEEITKQFNLLKEAVEKENLPVKLYLGQEICYTHREDQIKMLLPPEYANLQGIASDRILCDGYRISVMMHEEPIHPQDSGWRFFAGDEDKDYITDQDHFGMVDLNLIMNYSPDAIPYLQAPVKSLLIREDSRFVIMPNDNPDESDE